jgi:glycosyltransferase involved in cell wall biosynthesis
MLLPETMTSNPGQNISRLNRISLADSCSSRPGNEPSTTEPRRLLIVSTVARTVSAFLLPYADYFRCAGWRVDAAANGIADCAACRRHFDRTYEVQWSRSPFDVGAVFKAIRRIRALCRSGKYDLVHVHTPIAAFVTRLALSRCGQIRPFVIYTAHGFHFHSRGARWKNLVFQSIEMIAGKWTDYLITINGEDYDAALRLRLAPPDRVRLMPGIGIDLDQFKPECAAIDSIDAVRRRLGTPGEVPIFLTIAEFIPRKRHVDVIRAIAVMQNREARLILVGDGPLSRALEALVLEYNLAGRVHFAGQQNDVRPFICAARAVLLPSFQEGLPRSVMESLACGVPVIGANIRGIRDLLSNGGGALFEPGDVAELARQMDWFADHPAEAALAGDRGRQAMAKYDISHLIQMHEHLYAAAAISGSRT